MFFFSGKYEYLYPQFFEELGLTIDDFKDQELDEDWRGYTPFKTVAPGSVIEFKRFSARDLLYGPCLCADLSDHNFLALPKRLKPFIRVLDKINEPFKDNRIFLIYGGKGYEKIADVSDEDNWYLFFDLMVVSKNRGRCSFLI